MNGLARIGMTTTVPVEIILAGGHVPVDLNNVFITGAEPVRRVEAAEDDGYPRNICGWIKGYIPRWWERTAWMRSLP